MDSLHKKITFSYSLFASLIFLLSIFAYSDLLYLRTSINEGSVVSDLKNNIAEMRRHEKNVFLYSEPEGLYLINLYTNAAIKNLNTHQAIYQALTNKAALSSLNDKLVEYQAFFASSSTERPRSTMDDIRSLGHNISESVENLANQERDLLASMANQSQWALAGAIFVMAIIAVAIGWRMSRVITTPLKRLVKNLSQITEDKFDHLEPVTRDREFVTLAKAFNHVLHELELRHRRMLQSEKLASLGVLISGVAHELNNPLANISSSCQLLIEEKDQADQQLAQQWLQQIDNETERAKNIVKALLDYGRNKRFQLEYICVNDLINKSLLLLKSELKHTCKVNLDIADDLKIHADMQRMQQVIINLVRNGANAGANNAVINISASPCKPELQAFPENTCTIGATDSAFDLYDNYCEITIADNGPGIPRNLLNRIFDPFFTTSKSGHGVGLGLYIVEEIIREHGGCIGACSHLENGSQFILRLPCKQPPLEESE